MAAHRRRNAPRVTTNLRGCLRTGGLKYTATICDLSMIGARLRIVDLVSFGEITNIDVPGLPALQVDVRWSEGEVHGVSFRTQLPMQILANLLSA